MDEGALPGLLERGQSYSKRGLTSQSEAGPLTHTKQGPLTDRLGSFLGKRSTLLPSLFAIMKVNRYMPYDRLSVERVERTEQ